MNDYTSQLEEKLQAQGFETFTDRDGLLGVRSGDKYLGTRAKYGKNNWLDWSVANWGTKWSAFRFDDDDHYSDGTITFVTVNNAPTPIMQKLSEMYPDSTMRHQWADDNVGHNCGERVYKAGAVIEEFKPEPGVKAVDHACKIMGTTPADHCLKLNEDGTEYTLLVFYFVLRLNFTPTSGSCTEPDAVFLGCLTLLVRQPLYAFISSFRPSFAVPYRPVLLRRDRG